uniref:Uncharacterized protein n=1 Tax=Setaria italica TaxID=4555 RepID=K4ALZ7_SETIT
MEEEHYSIYRINFIHDRIDVLDSSLDDHTDYHQVLGDRIIRRLNLLFQLATDFEMKQFTRFKHPIIDENIRQYRSQLLFYGLYHEINEIKKLPGGLEAHRRRMYAILVV